MEKTVVHLDGGIDKYDYYISDDPHISVSFSYDNNTHNSELNLNYLSDKELDIENHKKINEVLREIKNMPYNEGTITLKLLNDDDTPKRTLFRLKCILGLK